MEFLPAIDLKEGKCVRLLQGDAAKKTVYSSDPVAVAEGFQADGARWLHMVDLDGAFSGVRHHTAVVRQVKSATNLRIELGGGIRTLTDAESCLAAGAERIVLGTAAWQSPAFMAEAVKEFGKEHVAVGIDARGGFVSVKGWTETTDQTVFDLAKLAQDSGVGTLIYTDIAQDGMLSSPDYSTLSEIMSRFDLDLVASGGVASLEHISALMSLKPHAPYGCISGKAIYEERFSVKEAVALCYPNKEKK